MFQVMQGVIVQDEELEAHGQAGFVVNPNVDGTGKVTVKLDHNGDVSDYAPTSLRGL